MTDKQLTTSSNKAVELPADYVPVAGLQDLTAEDFSPAGVDCSYLKVPRWRRVMIE